MKNILILTFLMKLITPLIGQDNMTIEVLITDTMQLTGDKYIYSVMILPSDIYGQEMGQIIKKEDIKNQLKIKDLNKIIETNGLKKIDKKNNYQIDYSDPYAVEQVVNIEFESKQSLEKFVDRIKDYENVTGRISNIIVENREVSENILIKRLLKKGEKKAKIIASMIEKEIECIIELSELATQPTSSGEYSYNLNSTIGWTAYPALSQLSNMIGLETTSLTIEKTMRIKYKLK